jgi:hypothetical protein
VAEPAEDFEEPTGELDNLPRDDLWAIFDADARRTLGISGEEFLRRWDAGEYDGDEDEDEPRRRARARVPRAPRDAGAHACRRVTTGAPPCAP